MTGQEILNTIHTLYENNEDFPVPTDEDFVTRLAFLNQGILSWQSEVLNGFLWQELLTTTTLSYSIVSINDFLAPESLFSGGVEYKFYPSTKAIKTISLGTNEKLYYILGGANNKTINIYPAISGTYTITYYKQATLFTPNNLSLQIEMPNANYAIRYVLSQLYGIDGDIQNSQIQISEARGYMEHMKQWLMYTPMEDISYVYDTSEGFGI